MSNTQQNQSVQLSGALTGPQVHEGEIDRNVPQPRQPTNLQGLLRFAMEATKSEDAPNDPTFGPLDEERKKFLENALKSMTVDVIEVLYNNIQVLQRTETLKLDDDITEYLNAFESILEHVYMIDTAIDFHKIGGFTVFPPCLNCVFPEIRSSACDLLAELCQNNPYCQKVVIDSDLMEQIINLLKNDADEHVQVKAMYAISCNVRENAESTAAFVKLDGLNVILEALQRPNDKLRTKVTFLMTCLIGFHPEMRDKLIKHNVIEIVIKLIAQERMPSHEHLLTLLWLLILDNPEGLDICTKEEYGLEMILRNHLKYGLANPDMSNEQSHCELLLQAVISVQPDPLEADR